MFVALKEHKYWQVQLGFVLEKNGKFYIIAHVNNVSFCWGPLYQGVDY